MCPVKVSGVLGLVLRLSRIMGISMISLKRAENGYDAFLSYATVLYGYFSIIMASFLAIIGFILEVLYNNKFPTSSILNITTIITMCMIFSSNAKAKSQLILNHLTLLNKINNKLSSSIIKPQLLKQYHLALYLGCFIFYFCLTSLTIIKSVTTARNLPDYIYVSLAYPSLQILVLEAQMTSLKYKLYEALKNLTGELGNHLHLIKNKQLTVTSTQKCIRNTANAYFSVCKVIDEMNESDGKFYIVLMTSLVFYIVHATCDLIYRTTSDNNTFDIVYDVLWISAFVNRLYVIVEPCHHIAEETSKLKVLFSKLICQTTAVGKLCSWEWVLILHQLYLLEPTFTPFGMLTLDRALLTSIISITTTYLAIAIPHTKVLYKNMTFI